MLILILYDIILSLKPESHDTEWNSVVTGCEGLQSYFLFHCTWGFQSCHGWEEMAFQNLASGRLCQLLLLWGGSSWHPPIQESSKLVSRQGLSPLSFILGGSTLTAWRRFCLQRWPTAACPSKLRLCLQLDGRIRLVLKEGRMGGWCVYPIWELSKVEMPQRTMGLSLRVVYRLSDLQSFWPTLLDSTHFLLQGQDRGAFSRRNQF